MDGSQVFGWCWTRRRSSDLAIVLERIGPYSDTRNVHRSIHFVRLVTLCSPVALIISWYVIGQLMASVTLQQLSVTKPDDYKIAIYTQFAMLGLLAIIYVFLPETPWYLLTKGKEEQARKLLVRLKGGVPGYNVDAEIAFLTHTIEDQRSRAGSNGKIPLRQIFSGLNLKRLVIATWPKLTQQAVGLSVFNNYSTYFCEHHNTPSTS